MTFRLATYFVLALILGFHLTTASFGSHYQSSSQNTYLESPLKAGPCLQRDLNTDLMKEFTIDGHSLPIVIETSNRVTHQIVSQILKILLSEVVGYKEVIVSEKDGTVFTAREALQRLASDKKKEGNGVKMGESVNVTIPEPMINMEVWLSPGFNMNAMGITNKIEDCGPLGPIGRAGWYVPKSIVDKYYEQGLIIDHWRAFRNESITKMFHLSKLVEKDGLTKSNVTRSYYCQDKDCTKGIYRPPYCIDPKSNCATIFAAYTDHTLHNLKADIINLKLKVEVAWIGPNLETFVLQRVRRGEAVLFFNWKPNTLTHKKNFTNVAFPHCEDNNPSLSLTNGSQSPCDFEINQLEKFVWKEIKNTLNKDVYHVVREMNFSQTEYLHLLDMYQEAYRGSKPPSTVEIACNWINSASNEITWHNWLPADVSHRKYPLYIGGIFPKTGPRAQSISIAAQMAIRSIDVDPNILNNYDLQLLEEDGACKADIVMKAFIGYVTNATYNNTIGILGPACSDTVEPIAGVAKHYNTIIISYSAEGALFNNRDKYPYFFRTIPENNLFRFVYLKILEHFKWKRISSLTQDGHKYSEYISLLETMVQQHGKTFVLNKKFARDAGKQNMTQHLLDLKARNAKIIIGDFYDNDARNIMCEAYKQNMTGKYGYVWFLPHWFSTSWYNTDHYNVQSGENVSCTTSEMKKALDGHIALSYKYFANDNDTMQENKTVRHWRELYEGFCQWQHQEPSDYAGYAYDAVWVYAKAVDALLKDGVHYRSILHRQDISKKLVKYINQTSFTGVSGRVEFNGSSRLTDVIVYQWIGNGSVEIGTYAPISDTDGLLTIDEHLIVWPTGRVPDDGTLAEKLSQNGQSCAIEKFRRALGANVSCESAYITANVIGLAMFSLLVAIGFFLFKRKYEEKFKRIKELGLMGANLGKLALDEWEMPRDHIVINRKLGEGAFGTVYGGEAFVEDKGWVAVAVKTLKVGADMEEKLDFLSEAEMMKRFDHSNIVRLLGVCTIGEPVYTVMEFMLYGDLKTYLLARRQLVKEKEGHNSDEISERQLTNMSLDIARGLSYLAEQKYVHRDLACRNCLVNANRTVKIGDFGMCRHTYDSDYYRFSKKGMLPVRWMAPESLIDGVFTPMSDVWSYAVLLYEIVTFGSFPYQGLSNNQVLDFVRHYNTLTVPKGCKPELEALFHRCWNRNPALRPTANEILEILAHHPTLIAPCLDLPLASVEVEDSNSIELAIHDRSRVHSITSTTNPIRRAVVERHHSLTHAENGSVAVAALNLDSVPNLTYRTQVIPAKGQYVTLQCKNSQDSDYGSSASRDLAQGITAL